LRLSKNLIEKIASRVVSDLKASLNIKILKKDDELVEIVKDAILLDLKIEDEITREAETLLKKHTSVVLRTGLDNSKALQAIKGEIAKERNYFIK